MAIDKAWIKIKDRTSPVFLEGLFNFMEYVKNYVDGDGKTKCPCRDCANMHLQSLDTVYAHIHDREFLQYYKTWIYHGEDFPGASNVEKLWAPNRRTPTPTNEILDAIEDVIEEQNTSERNVDEDEARLDPEFDELFKELNAELYPGCSWMSSLEFLAKLMHIKVINKWTNSSFDQLVVLLKDSFPKENRIPISYYKSKRKLRRFGLGFKKIHVCINDCCLFWKENASLKNCPICKESRYDKKNTKGKEVPRKVLHYFPLEPRLRRRYSSRITAKDMTWHNTGRSPDGMMRHPVDGKAWKEFDKRWPDFAEEPRNVRLGLAADGFNPFGNMSLTYSMWPVVLTTYNTPPWLCMKESSFMLTLLIPGPKSPGKDIDVFLRPLVDELKMLWEKGVRVRDASTNSVFTMRAALLWTINDYPARSSLSGWSGQGYKACPTCNIDTPSCRVTNKIAFVGHRRFLDINDRMREDLSFNGQTETRGPPRRFTNDEILEQLESLPNRVPGKHPSNGALKRKRDASELNWTKRSIFFELDYWSSLELKHNLDVMHIENNVCESLLGTLLMNEKSKDTPKARVDLKNMGIRRNLWLTTKNNKVCQPHGSYSFKPKDRERFCKFIRGVKLPDGFGSNFKTKVASNNSNITGLKSHDYHILMQRLLPVGVRAGLPLKVETTIIDLCTLFKKICSRSVDVQDMVKAQKEVVNILCNLESIYPPAFFDIMVHLVLHLPEEVVLGGPVFMRWMYPFERYMKTLKAYVRNKARPEGSIAEGYVATEALTFCSMYLDTMPTKFNRPDRNADAGIPKRHLLVFSTQCRAMSKNKIIALCEEARESLQWFVLNNCDEIKDYLSEFKSEFPGMNFKPAFISWFNDKVKSSPDCMNDSRAKELTALAHGPVNAYSYTACIVNGVRYVVHNRDLRRTTQNSGVVSFGEDGTPFYGQLDDIIQLNYISGYSVVLFRCKWFDTSGKRLIKKNNTVAIDISRRWYVGKEWYDDEQYIFPRQAQQVFYLQDPSKTTDNWMVVEDVHHRKLWDHPSISVLNEIDVLHNNQSSDYNFRGNLGFEVGESSARVVDDTQDLNLVIDLGDNFVVEEEDGDGHTSEEEGEINNDTDDDVVDTHYCNDDSD